MKKTYATSMPDRIGAFLEASKCFAALGINITRVSYDKAVDSHMLFLDVEGDEEKIRLADAQLEMIGYLQDQVPESRIVLFEFILKDVPGSVKDVLELIRKFDFNISYINAQGTGEDFQTFRAGLHVEDPDVISHFLEQVEKLCQVRVIDYNISGRAYDNSIFYSAFVQGLSQMIHLTQEQKQGLLVASNLTMQTLDQRGLSPHRTFDSISKFAELLSRSKKDGFNPRISAHKITENTHITVIEPTCGSNTTIIENGGNVLFIDSGYACHKEDLLRILPQLIPNFETLPKRMLLTHADLDHCGLINYFDEIILSYKSAQSLHSEVIGENDFREQNPLHKPYVTICKILTAYEEANPAKFQIPWQDIQDLDAPLTKIGTFDFGDLHFDVWEGKGGHLPGEIVLIDHQNKLAFTGDIYINVHGLIPEQAEYNRYAPILMTSVDTEPDLCRIERNALMEKLSPGNWRIFSGHGAPKELFIP